MEHESPLADRRTVPCSRERRPNLVRLVVLACCDVNAPCGDVFGLDGKSVMTIRTVANTLGEDVLGSLEYACAMQGASVIVVLGHSDCEAVAVACNQVEMGHLSGVLDRVGPAIRTVRMSGASDLSTGTFLDRVTLEHARRQAHAITTRSPVLARLSAAGRVSIIAAVADSDTGAVRAAHPAHGVASGHLITQMNTKPPH